MCRLFGGIVQNDQVLSESAQIAIRVAEYTARRDGIKAAHEARFEIGTDNYDRLFKNRRHLKTVFCRAARAPGEWVGLIVGENIVQFRALQQYDTTDPIQAAYRAATSGSFMNADIDVYAGGKAVKAELATHGLSSVLVEVALYPYGKENSYIY